MYRFNKRRRQEFLEAQAQLRADSLEAARLAYVAGTATEEQTAMVEEAQRRQMEGGGAGWGGWKLPQILGPPTKPVGGSGGGGEQGANGGKDG